MSAIARNLASLQRVLAGESPVSLLTPEAGGARCFACPPRNPRKHPCFDLNEFHVIVHQGYFFDFATESVPRGGLLPHPQTLMRASAVLAGVHAGPHVERDASRRRRMIRRRAPTSWGTGDFRISCPGRVALFRGLQPPPPPSVGVVRTGHLAVFRDVGHGDRSIAIALRTRAGVHTRRRRSMDFR